MNADTGCRLVSHGSAKKKDGAAISASVGTGGRNVKQDVLTVQELLNGVRAGDGGPLPLLAVDGLIGPKSIGAIQRFQRAQLGWADGRIDPAGPTIARLTALSKGGAKPAAGPFDAFKGEAATHTSNPILDALRLTTMTISVPDARTAVTKAILTVEQSFTFVMLGGSGLTGNPKSFEMVDRHFLFKDVPRERALSELQFMATTLRRMKAVLDKRTSVFGGPMFGPNLFETDPHQDKTDPRVKAYVPLSSVQHSDGLTPHKIYLCRGLDGQSQDRYTHILIHEMGHFVDDEAPETEIADHGYAFFDTLKTLPHEKRIHNADTYAIFAFENAFGKARVVAMFPKLR
jgi:hypothetical protein